MGGGGYSRVNFGHLKSELFRNGGRYSGVNFGHLNLNFSEMGVGGGLVVWNSRKGLSGKFGQKFTVQPETCCASQIVSHILRMWKLKKQSTCLNHICTAIHLNNYCIFYNSTCPSGEVSWKSNLSGGKFTHHRQADECWDIYWVDITDINYIQSFCHFIAQKQW